MQATADAAAEPRAAAEPARRRSAALGAMVPSQVPPARPPRTAAPRR